ncbi:MAG: nucleoside phosphorylase [Nitrospirota bacterium]
MKKDGSFRHADLPTVGGRVYHLDLEPEELAKKIIIVGDPERVPFIADTFMERKEVDRSHRGLRTVTGYVKETGQRVSVITSGMGTPSLEIVLNEIVALNEIDLLSGTGKSECEMITAIRVGTSGGVQAETDLGTLIITDYAVGLDNTGLFYNAPCYSKDCEVLEEKIRNALDMTMPGSSYFRGKIQPYVSRAHEDLVNAMEKEAQKLGIKYKKGVTITNSGFFANQGRDISRIPLTIPDIDIILASVDTGIKGLKIENMEMEASFFMYFMAALGYKAGVICPVIDKRLEDKFMTEYAEQIKVAAGIALKALNEL